MHDISDELKKVLITSNSCRWDLFSTKLSQLLEMLVVHLNGYDKSLTHFEFCIINQCLICLIFALWWWWIKFSAFSIISHRLHSLIYLTSTNSFITSHALSLRCAFIHANGFFFNMHVECIQCGWLQSNIHFNLIRLISGLINSSVRSLVPYSPSQQDLNFSAVICAGVCRDCQTHLKENNTHTHTPKPPYISLGLNWVTRSYIPLISSTLLRQTTNN